MREVYAVFVRAAAYFEEATFVVGCRSLPYAIPSSSSRELPDANLVSWFIKLTLGPEISLSLVCDEFTPPR